MNNFRTWANAALCALILISGRSAWAEGDTEPDESAPAPKKKGKFSDEAFETVSGTEAPEEKPTAEKPKKKKKKKKKSEGAPIEATADAPGEKKARRGYKLGVRGVVAGGADTNTYNRAEGSEVAGSGEATAKAQLDVPASNRLSWSTGLSAGGSYRGGTQSAAKVKAGAQTGLTFLLAGNKKLPGGKKLSKKKQKFPSLTLSVSAKYGFSANPVNEAYELAASSGGLRPAQDPPPEEPPPEEPPPEEELADNLYATDPELEEILEDDDDDFGDEDSSDDEDTSDEEEESSEADQTDDEAAEEESDSDFADEDVLTGSSFGLKNPKHKLSGSISLGLEPWRMGSISLGGTFARGIVGVDEGKPSADYTQLGGALKLKQSFSKFGLGATFGLDNRSFDEKVTSRKSANPGVPIHFLVLVPGAYLELKPLKPLKLKLGYRYQLRTTDVDENLESFKHGLSLMGRLALTKGIGLFLQTSYAFQGRIVTVDKDSTRLQGVLGFQIKS
ncbi:MAG: hypothetical protein HY791_05555 [Deltaproteobacteria bacterium]|nr:hypothetical protein [Deltaproteobacteria bacterium]